MAGRLTNFSVSNPPGVSTREQPNGAIPIQMLGLPKKVPQARSGDGFLQTTYSLAEMYDGKSEYLGNTITIVAMSHNDWLNILLPIVKTNQLQAHFTEWRFPVTLPDYVPEGGVVRLLQSYKVRGSMSINRIGVGFKMNHSEMTTPEGKIKYATHLEQLSMCIIEGLKAEALNALTTVGDSTVNQLETLKVLSKDQYSRIVGNVLEREVKMWGVLQQHPNGWAIMDDYITMEHDKLNTSDPLTTYITDVKCHSYLTTVANDQVNASIFGPNAQDKLKTGIQYFKTDLRGNTVYLARPLLTESNESINYFRTIVQIGEFFRDQDIDTFRFDDSYSSSLRTQQYFSESADTFVPMTLAEKLRGCFRFDESGNLRDIKTLNYYQSVQKTISQQELAEDFLHYYDTKTDTAAPLKYFGQMRKKHHPLDAKIKTVDSVYAQLKRTTGRDRSVYVNAFRRLSDCVKVGLSLPFDASYAAFVRHMARTMQNEENISENRDMLNSPEDVKCNQFGSVSLDTTNIPMDVFAFPPLYANYAGFKTIESESTVFTAARKISQHWADVIKNDMPVFDEFASELASMFPGSALLTPRLTYPAISNPSPAHVLFDNIIMSQHPYRNAFIRRTVASEANFTTAVNNPNQFTIDMVKYDATFPEISSMRQVLMNTLVGKYDPDLGVLIGADINFSGRGATNVLNYRKRQGSNFGVFSSVTGIDQSLDASSPTWDKTQPVLLHAVLTRLTLMTPVIPTDATPDNIKNVAKAHCMLLLAMAMIKSSDNFKWLNEFVAEVLVKTGVDMWTNEDTNVLFAAFYDKFKDSSSVRTLQDKIVKFIRKNASGLKQSLSEFNGAVQECMESINRADVAGIDDGYTDVVSRDPILGRYVRTPFVIGKKAILSLLSYSAQPGAVKNVANYITFASAKNPRVAVSDQEITAIETFARNGSTSPEDQSRQLERIGYIFKDVYASKAGDANVDNLPLIGLAKTIHTTRQSSDIDRSSSISQTSASSASIIHMSKRRRGAGGMSAYDTDTSFAATRMQPKFTSYDMLAEPTPSYVVPNKETLDDILTSDFKENFTTAVEYTRDKLADMAILLAWLFTPITKYNLEKMIEKNVKYPWDHLCMRPYITWETATVIKMAPGLRTGSTNIGNILTEIGDDAATQSHTFSLHAWCGAAIYKEENIFRLPSACVTNYISGGEDGIIHPDKHRPFEGLFGGDASDSFIIAAIPLTERISTNAISTTGNVNYSNRHGGTIANDVKVQISTYSTAPYQCALYGLSGTQFNNPTFSKTNFISNNLLYQHKIVTPNAIVFKARVLFPDNSGKYTIASSQTGHWTNDMVVPGAARARRSEGSKPSPLQFTTVAF